MVQVIKRVNEEQIELFPQILLASCADDSGETCQEHAVMYSREQEAKEALTSLASQLDQSLTGTTPCRVWYKSTDGSGHWMLQGIAQLGTSTLGDLNLADGTRVVLEPPNGAKWPFERRSRLTRGQQTWKDPAKDSLQVGDKIDVCEQTFVSSLWFEGTVMMAEAGRVLVAMKDKGSLTVNKAPLTASDGGLSEAVKLVFKSWFDTYADSEGKMDQAAMAQWVKKAAKTECAVDDVRVTSCTESCYLAVVVADCSRILKSGTHTNRLAEC